MPNGSITIIGRGIAGLSAAFELTQHGLSVVVIGPNDINRSATGAAVGLSSLKGQWHANKPLFSAKVEGHRFLLTWVKKLEASSGIRIPQFLSSSLEPFWTMTEYEKIRERVFHRAFSGHTGATFTDTTSDLNDLYRMPPLGAALYDGDYWFDPRTALVALEQALKLKGVQIIDDQITKIEAAEATLALQGQAAWYKSDHIIIAAGICTDKILENSMISGPKQKGVYGETLVTPKFSHACPQIIHMGQKHLIGFEGTGRFGSSALDTDDFSPGLRFNDGNGEGRLDMDSRFVDLGFNPSLSTTYAGVRGRYRDIAPCIGELKVPNSPRKVVVFTGFYKSGLQLAPLFSAKLAKFYAGSSAFLCESQFSVGRFSSEF
jgi:glycine/D-amino acid oxidase-like deaminating enzyme